MKHGVTACIAWIFLLTLRLAVAGRLDDPWQVTEHVGAFAAEPMLQEGYVDARCPAGGPGEPLGLLEAIERSLCHNPKTQQAWADLKAAAQAVGVAKAAYLPTLDGSAQDIAEHVRTDILGQPNLDSNHNDHAGTQTLTLNWVLFDFGARQADLTSARKLYTAAEANRTVALQTAFLGAAKDYFTAQAGLFRWQAMARVQEAAQESYQAARSRMERGSSPAADVLQAQTAFVQAEYTRVKAEAGYRSAVGALAVDMGEMPDQHLALPLPEDKGELPAQLQSSITDLIAQAQQDHPTVQAARAQWESAQAKADALRAQGWATVSLIGQSSRNNSPTTTGVGQPYYPAYTHDNYLGIKVDVPLFEGQGRGYKVRQALEQANSQREAMQDAERQVASSVWSSYQELLADSDNIKITDEGLQTARQAMTVMQARYRDGMSNIIELLNVQQALARAEEQHVEALADGYTARLQLAASLGRIDLLSVSRERP